MGHCTMARPLDFARLRTPILHLNLLQHCPHDLVCLCLHVQLVTHRARVSDPTAISARIAEVDELLAFGLITQADYDAKISDMVG